jgi:hypothetical protein
MLGIGGAVAHLYDTLKMSHGLDITCVMPAEMVGTIV